MAPRMKRAKGKEPQEFDETKFVSFEASESYVKIMQNRKLIPERGFNITKSANPTLFRMILYRNWSAFTKSPFHSLSNLVREFYANADEHSNGKVWVRGKIVSFSSSSINNFYGLPDIPHSEYRAYVSTFNYEEIRHTLCIPGTTWKMSGDSPTSLPAASLNVNARAWQYFVCHRLMPALHYSDLTVERAILIYAILMGMTVDVGQVICKSILHTVRLKLGLYFPSLITQLCIRAGVPHSTDEETQPPKKPIDDGMLAQIKASRPPTSSEGAIAASTPPPSRNITVAERLERLESRFDEHHKLLFDRLDRQDQMLARQDRFLARQADYQAEVNSAFGQMYQHLASATGCNMGLFPTMPPYPGSFFDPPPEEGEGTEEIEVEDDNFED